MAMMDLTEQTATPSFNEIAAAGISPAVRALDLEDVRARLSRQERATVR